MPKKVLCLFITLLLLMGAARAAEPERVQVVIDYEGSWVFFEEFSFKLYLPNDFYAVKDPEDLYFMAVDETLTQSLSIEAHPGRDMSFAGVLSAFSGAKGFDNVREAHINGVPFVGYSTPASNLVGFATVTPDGSCALLFKFMPASDEALAALAVKIMASLSPIQ